MNEFIGSFCGKQRGVARAKMKERGEELLSIPSGGHQAINIFIMRPSQFLCIEPRLTMVPLFSLTVLPFSHDLLKATASVFNYTT